MKIELDQIEQNENSRVVYKEGDLSELMASMKQHGLLQPVGLRKLPTGKYDAVYGNRRILAAKKLGWHDIDAKVIAIDNDADRDILNLVENIKRKNTTLAEDGRMFQILLDRGLSLKELAARLDISSVRIETALEVLNNFPKDFHPIVVNKPTGAATRGKISASVAHAVMNLRKGHALNRKQVRLLLNKARDGASVHDMAQVAPLVKQGFTFEQALLRLADTRPVQIVVFVDRKQAEKAEKKAGVSISEILTRTLLEHSDLKIIRRFHAVAGKEHYRTRPRSEARATAS